MASVFISYRKDGADQASSRHLAQDLREALGDEHVFRDEALGLGRFEDQLEGEARACRAMLAVIGPVWVERTEDLHRSEDWVRRELELGLGRGILMVPLLVDGAAQPPSSDLPKDLRGLFEYQAVCIHSQHWSDDVGKLGDSLAKALGIEKRSPAGVEVHDLTGDWVDTDGVPVRIQHQGDRFQMSLLGPGGMAVGGGQGLVEGNRVEFALQRPDLGNGQGTGTISPDGRQVSGEVQYGYQRFGFSISRR